jgi:hypothetical protein
MTQTSKVLNFLRKNAYREYNAKTLARHLKIETNKMKVYLNRLHNKGLIMRTTKGMYKAYADMTVIREQQLTNPPTLLHGIMMECSVIKLVTKYPPGALPKRKIVISILGKKLVDWLKANEFGFRSDNNSWFRYVWYKQWRITLTITSNGKLCIYISASKHPLSLPEFDNILIFLDGYLEEIAPFNDRKVVRLKEVGVAKDFKELRLDGVKSVSLRAFHNAWTRIYYKDDQQLTRVEHHLVLDMPLDDALKSLSILTTPVNYINQLNGKIDEKRDVT